MGEILTWVKCGQDLGNFPGLGKGLVNFHVAISHYVSTICENKNFRLDFHTAEVTDSNSVPPIDCKSLYLYGLR